MPVPDAPDSMHAYVLEQFGAPDVYVERELPVPQPGPGEALVRVLACGVCGEDVMARAGRIPHYERLLPLIMGHELAGQVVALGPDTSRVSVGDRVITRQGRSCHECRYCRTGRETVCASVLAYGEDLPGGYAEFVVLDAQGLVRIPAGLGYADASIVVCAMGTVFKALKLAEVRPGERVLVTGATGGLGVHALQLVKAFGATPIAATTRAEAVDLLRGFTDEVVVAPDGRFAEAVRGTGAPPAVVVELTAGITLDQSLRAVARAGRVVIVGNVDPRPIEILPGALIMREVAVLGSASTDRESIEDTLRLVVDGRIKPVVAERFPFSAIGEAHAAVEARRSIGRYVLERENR